MSKLTKVKLKYFIKDELKAIKEYRAYELDNLADDETRHYQYLLAKLRREEY